MNPEMIELAKRAVACKGWRWMPGMSYWWHGHQDRVADTEPGTLRTNGELLPDLTDPATLGCLLALVREAWNDPGVFVRPRGSKMRPDWAVFTGANSDIVCAAPSEAEALVVALEGK